MNGKRNRKRRIIRAIVLLVATLLLLPAAYISTWIVVCRGARENVISSNTALSLRSAFSPLIQFSDTEYPGGAELNRLWWRINRKVVTNGNVRIEYATSALALAPPDLARRAEMGDLKVYPQPIALPQPVAHDASAMRR